MSPSRTVKQLDAQINRILRNFDLQTLGGKDRDILSKLQQNLVDARIYTYDYELSETRAEQQDNAKKSKKWLEQARKNILAASEFNIFGALDVAHLSAQIEQIISELK
jgi:multidrug efflux pump subunit AcrA (membrane-fusion protein)